jgi:heat shock protein HslJ
MLDASIAALTGLTDARQAWAALFAPDERIAIKVNTIQNSLVWTHVPLVMAVAECLQQAGVLAEQIAIYDRDSAELKNASYEINEDGRGIRCSATSNRYSSGWNLVGSPIRLSNILLSCHAVINMPILKSHSLCGITFAMKNHYGTFDRPESYHTGEAIMRGIAELNALPPIRERHRLVIGDVLTTCLREASTWPYWRTPTPGDAILMSFDPVAHDTIGLEMYSQLLAADGGDPTMARDKAEAWLANAAALGLGTNDASHIELAELSLS